MAEVTEEELNEHVQEKLEENADFILVVFDENDDVECIIGHNISQANRAQASLALACTI